MVLMLREVLCPLASITMPKDSTTRIPTPIPTPHNESLIPLKTDFVGTLEAFLAWFESEFGEPIGLFHFHVTPA
jgi:hypothetical protein